MLKPMASSSGPFPATGLKVLPSSTSSPWAWAAVTTHPILWLEEALPFPPRVPGSLHILRAVGVRHGATNIWEEGEEASVKPERLKLG